MFSVLPSFLGAPIQHGSAAPYVVHAQADVLLVEDNAIAKKALRLLFDCFGLAVYKQAPVKKQLPHFSLENIAWCGWRGSIF